MKRFSTAFAALALILQHFPAQAALDPGMPVEEERMVSPIARYSDVRGDGIYSFSQEVDLQGMSPQGFPETLRFSEGELVAVQFGSSNQVLIHLIPDTEEAGLVPERLLISMDDFIRAGLVMEGAGGPAELAQGYEVYEDTEVAGRMVLRAKGRGVIARGCVAYVLSKLGMKHLGRVGNGVGMTRTLKKKAGYKNVSCSRPPKGAVASWSGGSRGAGHTAIWNGKGWCFDQGCFNPGKRYRLIECVAKK